MKTLINAILIAFVATLFTSCMALQGGAYSQSVYDRDYGYYDNDDYYDDDYYYGDNDNYYNRGGVNIQVFTMFFVLMVDGLDTIVTEISGFREWGAISIPMLLTDIG